MAEYEVGYSEPLPQLRRNAEWWLVESKGQTSVVITVLVVDNSNLLDVK